MQVPVRSNKQVFLKLPSRAGKRCMRCVQSVQRWGRWGLLRRSKAKLPTKSHALVLATIVLLGQGVATSAYAGGSSRGPSGGLSAMSALSLVPLASLMVVSTASEGIITSTAAADLIIGVTGSVLVVKSVEASATGSVYVLERVSDGVRVSVGVVSEAGKQLSVGVGTALTVSVVAAGTILSSGGETVAFIPNEQGKQLLHNERITP